MTKELYEKGWIRLATRYRYSLPVLAELHRDRGCKFVTLIRRLEASDRAIRQALDYLMEIGLAIRNPGYGHPLRPEYILTEGGEALGAKALEVWDALGAWSEQNVALERWPLHVLLALGGGPKRFAQIQKSADGLTPRALALALKKLTESGLIIRTLIDGHPPTAEYSATNWGSELAALM